MAAIQGPGRAEEEQLLWPGGKCLQQLLHSLFRSSPSPGAGKGNPHPSQLSFPHGPTAQPLTSPLSPQNCDCPS